MSNLPDKVTGDTYQAAEFTEFKNETQNSITSSGQTLASNSVQLKQAMTRYAGAGAGYVDSGAADAYILGPNGSFDAPTAYLNTMTARFVAGNTNTGASTVNVNGVGVKNIKKNGYADNLAAGDITAGDVYELIFSTSADAFELIALSNTVNIPTSDNSVEIPWTFDTATSDVDPGTGKFRFNNATPASITEIYYNDTNASGVDASSILLGMREGNTLYIQQSGDSGRTLIFTVSGVPTDATTYVKVPVAYVDDSSSFIQNGESAGTIFIPSAGGGLELLDTRTASGSATLEFDAFINSTYSVYLFLIESIAPVNDVVNLWMRVSIDGGSSYEAGASDYRYASNGRVDLSAGAGLGDSSVAAAQIPINDSSRKLGNAAGEKISATLYLYAPSVGNEVLFKHESTYVESSHGQVTLQSAPRYFGSNSAVNGIQFLMSAGNIASGTIKMYGISN
jgi:hypothetical protein